MPRRKWAISRMSGFYARNDTRRRKSVESIRQIEACVVDKNVAFSMTILRISHMENPQGEEKRKFVRFQ